MYTNCYRSYNALDVSNFYHQRIDYGKLLGKGNKEFVEASEMGLDKYNGVSQDAFSLFLKACGFRFHYGIPEQ